MKPAGCSIILADGKGETADLFLRAIAARLMNVSAAVRAAVLRRLFVFRFFAGAFLAPWRLLGDPHARVSPLTQAHALVEAVEGAVNAPLGSNQSPSMSATASIAIALGWNATQYRYALADRAAWPGFAERAGIPEARAFVMTRFVREKPAVTDGITARLDGLLRIESLKAADAADGCVDMRAFFGSGAITVLDFGGAPLGAEDPRCSVASVAITRVAWSAFDTPERRAGYTLIVADELQEMLTPAAIRAVERIVTTGRSFRVGFVAAHQGTTQIPASLQSILGTNVRVRALGRTGEADARAAAEWLPRTGRLPRPRIPGSPTPDRPEFLGRAEEAQHWIDRLGVLAPRHFLVADRAAPFAPRVVQARPFDPPPWDAIDPDVAAAVLRGAVGRPREELLAHARDVEERAASALIAAQAREQPARRSAAVPVLPDVVGRAATRRRKGGGGL